MSIIQTKQVNITQVYEEGILDIVQLKIVDIRNKIIELWDKQPIITQFPDMVAIAEPTEQLSCIIQGKKVIISNENIKEFKARDLDNFIKFVISFSKILGKPLKVFGFNYTFLFDFPPDKITEIRTKNKNLLNFESLSIKKDDFLGNGINVAFMQDSNRVQIVSTPNYDDTLKNVINLIIQTNIHFYKNEIPAFSDLMTEFKNHHDKLIEKIDQIFSEK